MKSMTFKKKEVETAQAMGKEMLHFNYIASKIYRQSTALDLESPHSFFLQILQLLRSNIFREE